MIQPYFFSLEECDRLNKEGDVNDGLEKVNTWSKLNKLFLNAQKIILLVFHRKQKHVDAINVQINYTKIERAESFNFLGIMLDENRTWKSHIEMVCNKISKVAI